MDVEEAFLIADAAVFEKTGKHLSDIQRLLFNGAWEGQTYEEIAEQKRYSERYLKQDIGPKFWKLLTEALGEEVGKKNFKAALTRRSQSSESLVSQDSNEFVRIDLSSELDLNNDEQIIESNLTQKFIDYLNQGLLNYRVQRALNLYERHSYNIPLLGEISWDLNATGWAECDYLIHFDGYIQQVGVSPDVPVFYRTELEVEYHYKSWTHAEATIPAVGNLQVDRPWNNSYPEGKITAYFKAQQNSINLTLKVEPGNDDRPNRFVKDIIVAEEIRKRIEEIYSSFTGTNI